MIVIEQTRPEPMPLPGVAHTTWAGQQEGLSQLSVWRQTMAPGAATPAHQHDCDEVVLCLAGQGEVEQDGMRHRIASGTTVVLPRGGRHQLFNTGAVPMEIIGIFGASPVVTRLPDGSELPLPWRT